MTRYRCLRKSGRLQAGTLEVALAEMVKGDGEGNEEIEDGVEHHDAAGSRAGGERGKIKRAGRRGLHDVRSAAPDGFARHDDA